MKKIIPFAIILIIGIIVSGLSGYFYANYRSGAREGKYENPFCLYLTVKRSDSIPDGQAIHASSTGQNILSFTVTNRSMEKEYAIDTFWFYPGVYNAYPTSGIKNLRVFNAEGVQISATSSALGAVWEASSTPPTVIPVGSSKDFFLKADIIGPLGTTSTTTILQVALGNIDARDAYSDYPQLAYKEINWHLLGRPALPIDESIESARFIIWEDQ